MQQVLFEQKSFFRKRAVILGSYQFWQLSPLRPPEFMFLSVSEYADSASATNCLSVFDHFVELALKGLNEVIKKVQWILKIWYIYNEK